MNNLNIAALLLISAFTLSACGNKPATSEVSLATRELVKVQPTASESEYVHKEDMYETSYSLLRAACIKNIVNNNCEVRVHKVITWGKPSEIGIIYLQGSYPSPLSSTPVNLLPREGISETPGTFTFDGSDQQVVIKSRGILPTLKTPLESDRFTPISDFISHTDTDVNNKISKTGSIKVISVRKLTLQEEKAIFDESDAFFYRIKAPVSMASLSAYYDYYKDKPDIKPHQTDKITWQEGQPPQVIALRK